MDHSTEVPALPWLEQVASHLSFFWGGRGKFCISGRTGLGTSTPRPRSPHLLHLPLRQLRGPSVSGGRKCISKGQLAQFGAPSPCGSRNPWAEAAPTPRSLSFLKPPGPSFGGNITPRAIFRERAVRCPCLLNVVFLFPLPLLLPLSPPPPCSFKSQFVYDCLDNRGGNEEPAERKVLYKTNEYIAGRGGIVSRVRSSLPFPVADGGSRSFLFVDTAIPTPVLKFVKGH